jgi:hypothetical protein
MKTIKTNTLILDLRGKPVRNADNSGDFTLGELVSNVLSGKTDNPHRAYQLAKKFAENEELNLKAEDILFVRTEIEKNGKATDWGYNSLLTGQAIELIDGVPEDTIDA